MVALLSGVIRSRRAETASGTGNEEKTDLLQVHSPRAQTTWSSKRNVCPPPCRCDGCLVQREGEVRVWFERTICPPRWLGCQGLRCVAAGRRSRTALKTSRQSSNVNVDMRRELKKRPEPYYFQVVRRRRSCKYIVICVLN